MAVAPSLLYRGTLTNTNATLKTTDAVATTVVTSIIATNKTASAATFTISVNGFYFAYQMPIAAYQTVTIDVKQVTGTNINIQGLASANSTVDVSISGVVSTGPADQAWTAYTPTLTASTTNPTNWTNTGKYMQVGKLVVAKFKLLAGGSMTAGSGTYYISAPVTPAVGEDYAEAGNVSIFDASASLLHKGQLQLDNTNTRFRIEYAAAYPTGGITLVAHNTPWTWAASDAIRGILIYEAV